MSTVIAVLDLITLLMLGLVSLVLSAAMLRHVVYWTGMGRNLFVFFAFLALSVGQALYWRVVVGHAVPPWSALLFRLPIVISGMGILYCLWRYPWPLPSEGVKWAELLGLRREESREV